MNEIKAGDVVQIKSGSHKMTVSFIDEHGRAVCQYFDSSTNTVKHAEIYLVALIKVS